LYINVYAPLPLSKPLKGVVLWIHGGGYQGEGTKLLDGAYDVSLSNGSMILVTFNSRLNVFGFAASELLRGRDPEGGTGNYGILDQRLAMQWVRDNIAAFGGDASRVTILGQSSGGNSVSNHLVRHKSHGLFAGAVIESGPFYPTGGCHFPGETVFAGLTPSNYTVADKEPVFAAMMERADCTDVDCLLKLPAAELLKVRAAPDCGIVYGPNCWPWVPSIDGVDLVANPWELLMHGEIAPVPVLIGSNAEDLGCLPLGWSCDQENCTEREFYEMATKGWGFNDTEANRLVHLYGHEGPRLGVNVSKWYRAFQHAGADAQMTCNSRRMARWVTQGGQPAFWYYWEYAPQPAGIAGAFHSIEEYYVFHEQILPSESEWSDTVATYWTSFVTSGKPHVPGSTSWPQYTPGEGSALIFNDNMTTTVADHLFEGKCDFWDDHFSERWGLPRDAQPTAPRLI
jgi:para-nitrobenzyl esterase